MEINFVTGKGGVGKSAVAAALALRRAREGKRTALVELGDQSYFRDFFGLSEVSYRPQSLEIGGVQLGLAQWSGQECLREYALHILKIESLYRLLLENSVSRALMNVAPALPELAILGKITSGPPRNVGPKFPYDVIVVDAYASGHFMALLQAPEGLGSAIRFGPMGEQARSIQAVLKDPKICHYFVVTLPEELPVVEGLELADNIRKLTGQKAKIIYNRQLEIDNDLGKELDALKSSSLEAFGKYLAALRARQNSYLSKIQKSGFSVQGLPWVLSADAKVLVDELSKRLAL